MIDKIIDETDKYNETTDELVEFDIEYEDSLPEYEEDMLEEEEYFEESLLNHYIDEGRLNKRLPGDSFGYFEGEEGDSVYHLNPDAVVTYNGKEYSLGEVIDSYGIDFVEFNENEPDFAPFAEPFEVYEIQSSDRQKEHRDYYKFLEENYGFVDAERYFRDNLITAHETPDGNILALDSRLHAAVAHTGGIAIEKCLERDFEIAKEMFCEEEQDNCC